MQKEPINPSKAAKKQASHLLGRISKEASEPFVDLYEAPHLEREKRQLPYFLKVDLAQVVMLEEAGVLTSEQASHLLQALRKLQGLGLSALSLDSHSGSMLFQIEAFLDAEVGEDLGGRVHIGRSRLDQGPTVRRLYKRDMVLMCLSEILTLRSALIQKARNHRETVLPGYTCLQHAHPAVFGHYLLSFDSKLADDFDRLVEAFQRLNRSPLGGAGLSGTSWPIDRQRTAELLGFNGLVTNSKLVREAYYAAEIASGLAMLMSTLNDLATDLHLWSSYEFAMVELADEFCGTSSIFPQKKNPAALEAIKFAAGEATAWQSILLSTFRAEGTGDVVMREAPLLDHASTICAQSLRVMAPVISTLEVKKNRMLELAEANWSTATALADTLVRDTKISFRTAHTLVARFVRLSIERGMPTRTADAAILDEAARDLGLTEPKLSTAAVRAAFDVVKFTQTRISEGSVNPKQIDQLLLEAKQSHDAAHKWLEATRTHITNAEDKLDHAVAGIVALNKG